MKRFRVFPGIIFVLLGMNFTIVGITVYAASSDGGAAVEPDYYRKAMAYDTIRRQELESAALGWTYQLTLAPTDGSPSRTLRAEIAQPDGSPVVGATVHADAFPSVRANDRVRLLCREAQPGVYAAPVTINHPGAWRVELTIESAGRIITHKSDVFVTGSP